MSETSNQIELMYDGECPLCDAYCHHIQIPDSVGKLRLVNARRPVSNREARMLNGLNVDEHIVLQLRNVRYVGADAMHVLALLSTRSGLLNRVNYWIFRSRRRSRGLYPILRVGRSVLLKLLGRDRLKPQHLRE
jgi:predicted DCC family thiol-disulfide oxidoreductase YuxK